MKFELRGVGTDNGIELSKSQKSQLVEAMKHYKGKQWVLQLAPPKRMKTNEQLGYLYGCVYPSISNCIKELIDEDVSIDKIDSIFKARFLSEEFHIGDNRYRTPKSLSTSSTKEVAKYIDNILKHVALPPKTDDMPDGDELGMGLLVPSPEEYYTK